MAALETELSGVSKLVEHEEEKPMFAVLMSLRIINTLCLLYFFRRSSKRIFEHTKNTHALRFNYQKISPMYARSFFALLLLALCALSTVLAFPPPPPSTDLLSVTSPRHNAVYHVGDQVDVRISIVGGTSGALYRANPEITILLQKDIRLPALNVQVGKIRARELFHNGFRFRVKSRYLIREQANVPYRVRTSFDLGRHSGFADSASFRLVRNSHPGNNGH